MSSRTDRRGSALAAAALAGVAVLLGSAPAWAEPSGAHPGGRVRARRGAVRPLRRGARRGPEHRPRERGRTVAGLEAATTATRLNEAAAAPVWRNVMLALDSSGSMAEFGKLAAAKDAANAYLAGLPADVAPD